MRTNFAYQETVKVKQIGTRLVLCCVVAVYAAPAHAYLDPGTGSLLIQGIIASIAAAAAVARLYWHRIIGLFRSKKSQDEVQTAENADDNAN